VRPAGPLDFLAVDAALARFRARHAIPAEFAAWEGSFWARHGAGEAPLAYLAGDAAAFVEGSRTHRVVLYADPGMLPDLIRTLQADPAVHAISLSDAGDLPDFRVVERWEHRFDLRFAPAEPAPVHAPLAVEPWVPGRQADAADLLSAVNATTVDGLYLTWPDAPTQETCARVLAGLTGGSHGTFSPDVSFMAFDGDRLVGLTLVALEDAEVSFLFEIAVAFRYRGTGLARHMLDRLKVALAPRGFKTVRFLACGHNAAVQALFRPEEVASRALDRGFVWIRG